jgi:diguanylate cyclase (GGDEF)-like protein/PAS domain S-box-containing protein
MKSKKISKPLTHAVNAVKPAKSVNPVDYSFAINLMQFLVVPTFVLDKKGTVLIWNKACERLTGIPAHEVLGTKEHWRGFYDTERPCLADLIVQDRMSEIDGLYVTHDDLSQKNFGVHAETWCVAIDAGPIYDAEGQLMAVVETLRDMSSHKNAQTELERLANHDGLTGIFNRRGFDDRLHNEWSRTSREKQPLSLIMLDVDHFKRFNDTYGHQAGDDCLKKVAAVLAHQTYRPSDMAARYGGEEFAMILPSIDEGGASVVAQRICEGIAALGIPHSASGTIGMVTVSVGVATVRPVQGGKAEELIRLADEALYQAKGAGRNRVVVYESSPPG